MGLLGVDEQAKNKNSFNFCCFGYVMLIAIAIQMPLATETVARVENRVQVHVCTSVCTSFFLFSDVSQKRG